MRPRETHSIKLANCCTRNNKHTQICWHQLINEIIIQIYFILLFIFLSIQNVFGYKIYEDKSSTQLAIEYLEKNNVIQGWNNDKNFYIALATSYADLNNSKNKNFIKLRTLKSFEASLFAKSEIISFIKTEISAKDNTKTQVSENNEILMAQKLMLQSLRVLHQCL